MCLALNTSLYGPSRKVCPVRYPSDSRARRASKPASSKRAPSHLSAGLWRRLTNQAYIGQQADRHAHVGSISLILPYSS